MANAKIPSASLYVGDLAPEVNETILYETFQAIGHIASIRVCRDTYKPYRSLGYAYVNFIKPDDAERALDTLNNSNIAGRPCRIMWSQRDPSLRKSGVGNIFIKNLHDSIGHKELYDTFSKFGNILSCKVAMDETGKSKGFGFVHYNSQKEAMDAIDQVNEMEISGKKVFVGPFLPRKERTKQKEQSWTNVFVKNLDPEISEKQLVDKFSEYGNVLSVAIMRDDKPERNSKGFGFVNFERHEDAIRAVEDLHNKTLGSKPMWCGRHKKKAEREAEIKKRYQQIKLQRISHIQGTNLYIKNLDDDVDDERLKLEFQPFGTIRSYKVMHDEKGNSKGFGFINFTTPEEAQKAIHLMNGQTLNGCNKPLYVALHEPKEIRRQKLIQQFARKRSPPNNQVPATYYYGNGGVPTPYVYPPQMMARQRTPYPQHYPSPYPIPVSQAPPPRTNPRQAAPNVPAARGRNPQAQPIRRNPAQEEPESQLANIMSLPEEQRKLYLGEQLYPYIHMMEPGLAGKITGMLLDSGWSVEALHGLLMDRNLLNAKVNEAKEVLERARQSGEMEGDGGNNQ